MAAPDPEGFSLLAKVIAAGTAVAAPIGWLYTKLDRKADKHTVNNQFQTVAAEANLHRNHIATLFEKLEAHSRRDEELAREIMGKMGDNHAEILRELSRKADRR